MRQASETYHERCAVYEAVSSMRWLVAGWCTSAECESFVDKLAYEHVEC